MFIYMVFQLWAVVHAQHSTDTLCNYNLDIHNSQLRKVSSCILFLRKMCFLHIWNVLFQLVKFFHFTITTNAYKISLKKTRSSWWLYTGWLSLNFSSKHIGKAFTQLRQFMPLEQSNQEHGFANNETTNRMIEISKRTSNWRVQIILPKPVLIPYVARQKVFTMMCSESRI